MAVEDESIDFDLNNVFVSTRLYADGLYAALNYLAPFLTPSERRKLCFEKLGLKDNNVGEAAFMQAAVELTVCSHFARFFPDHFVYEDKVNAPKDVDCSFKVEGIKYNVEVKCADFSKQHAVEEGGGFTIGSHGRMEDFAQLVVDLQSVFSHGGHALTPHRHMDNNLKSYLSSAHDKFSPHTSEDEINVLVVGCDDAMDMQKWNSYLYSSQGLFTLDSYADRSTYDRVDLVLLTNLYHRHKDQALKDKLSKHWELGSAFCVICNNPRSPKDIERIMGFSQFVPVYNDELNAHAVEGRAPDFVLQTFVIASYVAAELQAKGIYSFQPRPAKPGPEDLGKGE